MTPSRTTRRLFLASMFASMAVVLAWAGWIGWREWPRWRAVREMRAAVEANEPARFLDAIEQVDSLGVAEAAADEIAPLGQHPDPRVRMYAVMARTVLRPRGPAEAKELIDRFDDPDEDIDVRRAAAPCLVLFGEQARAAVPSLTDAIVDTKDQRQHAAATAFLQLGQGITGPQPSPWNVPPNDGIAFRVLQPPETNATMREATFFLLIEIDNPRFEAAMRLLKLRNAPHKQRKAPP